MSIEEISTFKVNFSNNDFKQEQIKKLCEGYYSIVGSRINQQTIQAIFYYIRLLDQYGVSPLLFFSYHISARAKSEYVNEFLLDGTTETFITIPIPLLNVVEHTIYQMVESEQIIPRILNIMFDPFEVEWDNMQEYETIMKIFIDNGLDDIRYEYFMTIQFY